MKMRRSRNAKIVATLGPASSDPAVVRRLFMAGVDVFRLNFSHGSADDHRQRLNVLRELESETGRPIAIMADLQGPKLRVGVFQDGPVMLAEGAAFRLDLDKTAGNAQRVNLPHPEIFQALEPGAELLLDDGKLRLVVERCGADFAETKVLVGGRLSERKGVNVPELVLPITALTDKDRRDLATALELGVDWIALSFVQRPEDVAEARHLARGRAAILSKIEKPAAVKAYDAILQVSDGIMVARGDLGVELPVTSVPPIQKRLIRGARAAAKPVIVATQMLESMIESPVPTRAEVSDVATAIYEGADAIMLSAESAAGKYPVEAVTTMNNVALSVEKDPTYRQVITASRVIRRETISDGIVAAAREIAEATNIRAIVSFTQSGNTASLVARERPQVPIIALTPLMSTARRMALTWGLHCVVIEPPDRFKSAVIAAVVAARTDGFAGPEDFIALTAGVPFNVKGTTNILRVAPCDERLISRVDPE